MRRLHAFLISLVAVAALGACAPVAQAIVDATERNDGASLIYVTQGLQFDPGPAPAQSVVLVIQGTELALLRVPTGATCTHEGEQIDCRLGTVSTPTTVSLTGKGVVANVTWRRAGSSAVLLAFARVSVEGGGG